MGEIRDLVAEESAALKSLSFDEEENFPILFFDKVSNKTTKLVNNESSDNYQKGQNRNYEFFLKDVYYISCVEIEVEGYLNHGVFEISWNDTIKSKMSADNAKIGSGKIFHDLKCFSNYFCFKPPKEYIGNKIVKSVKVYGYSRDSFESITETIYDVQEYKKSIDSYCQKAIESTVKAEADLENFTQSQIGLLEEIDKINEKISNLSDQKSAIESDIGALELKMSSTKSEEANLRRRAESLDDSIDQKINDQKILNKDISNMTADLKKLKDSINLFPSEIGSFVDQGGRSISRYTILSFIPMIVLVFVTYSLFSNAADLTVVYKEQEDISLLTIILTRIPFVLISLTIIHACYKLVRFFLEEIVRINQQRLNLSKVSIIATDISSSSANELGLSEEEVYHLRTHLKMELLREHLKEYINTDYSYEQQKSILPESQSNSDVEESVDENKV